MGSVPGTGVFDIFSSQAVSILIQVFVNGTILFLLMSFIIARFHNVSSSCRHRMWFFVVCGVFALALFSHFIPHLHDSPLEVPVHKDVSFLPYEIRLPSASEITKQTIRSPEYSGFFDPAGEYNVEVKHPDTTAITGTKIGDIGLRWSSLAVLVWFSGMALVLVRILVGRIGLFFVFKNSRPSRSARTTNLLGRATACLRLTKKIELRISNGCIVPFTFSIHKPVILLPQNVDSWPEERLRAVLLHELCHIRRMDAITRGVARLVCVLFWFLPVIWILYRKLRREEENACDAMVVDLEVKPADYAGHLIDIARMNGGKTFFFGLDHAFARRGRLERRITGILTLRSDYLSSGRIFSMRFLSVFFSCLLLLIMLRPVSAIDHLGVVSDEAPLELLYGTWMNPSYDETWKHGGECVFKYAKMVVDRDGTIHFFQNSFAPEYSYIGEIGTWEVTNSWTDRAGDNWYKVKYYVLCVYATYYHLWKIDRSGNVLESMYHWIDYPKAFDREETQYRIYYRL